MTATRVLVIGATGLIGRPVTEQLVDDGFTVRAMVRDTRRAAALLPEACEIVAGDLRDEKSIVAALRNIDAVYLSLSNKMARVKPPWDADVDGTATVAECMKRAGVGRLLRLSAMGVELDTNWWVAREKMRLDDALIASELQTTIFRPTWLMESIPVTAMGPFLQRVGAPSDPLYWLAAEDLGRCVAAALRDDRSIGTIYDCQGPEPASMTEAYNRFARVWKSYFWVVPIPRLAMKLARPFFDPASYLDKLLEMTYKYVVKKPAVTNSNHLHTPTVRIEEFAEKLLKRGELPRKKL